MSTASLPGINWDLCRSFSAAADALAQRRASEIAEGAIADFIALDWIEWHGGTLRLTPLGHMALLRFRHRVAEAAA